MPPMPYYLEKGPMLSVVEDYLNADTARAVATLKALRLGPGDTGFVQLWNLPAFASTNLAGKPGAPYWQDFRDKWLGKGPNGAAGSMWIDYTGDVEGITRLTLRTALELALGVASDASSVPSAPPRHWPIDLYWKCGQNWFEGWISHRRFGTTGAKAPPGGDGHVVVVFATPSEGSTIVDRPADHSLVNPSADFAVDPTSAAVNAGAREASLMVVTHRHNQAVPSWSIQIRPVASTFEVRLNPARYVGHDGLVVVAPSERDGGVLADPRPYVAAP